MKTDKNCVNCAKYREKEECEEYEEECPKYLRQVYGKGYGGAIWDRWAEQNEGRGSAESVDKTADVQAGPVGDDNTETRPEEKSADVMQFDKSVNIMNRAREMLAESDMTLAEIAEKLGYQDVSTFSRSFADVEGISPTEYRKQFQNEDDEKEPEETESK